MNVYISFLDELATYWNQNGYKCKVDSRGIIFTVLEIINMNKSKAYIPQAYLEVMINDFWYVGLIDMLQKSRYYERRNKDGQTILRYQSR